MGCIQASAYTTGTILGTYSGVDALDQCNNYCGVCCIPGCESDFAQVNNETNNCTNSEIAPNDPGMGYLSCNDYVYSPGYPYANSLMRVCDNVGYSNGTGYLVAGWCPANFVGGYFENNYDCSSTRYDYVKNNTGNDFGIEGYNIGDPIYSDPCGGNYPCTETGPEITSSTRLIQKNAQLVSNNGSPTAVFGAEKGTNGYFGYNLWNWDDLNMFFQNCMVCGENDITLFPGAYQNYFPVDEYTSDPIPVCGGTGTVGPNGVTSSKDVVVVFRFSGSSTYSATYDYQPESSPGANDGYAYMSKKEWVHSRKHDTHLYVCDSVAGTMTDISSSGCLSAVMPFYYPWTNDNINWASYGYCGGDLRYPGWIIGFNGGTNSYYKPYNSGPTTNAIVGTIQQGAPATVYGVEVAGPGGGGSNGSVITESFSGPLGNSTITPVALPEFFPLPDLTSNVTSSTWLVCNDTIGQSGCNNSLGGGIWHSGTNCANYDCNPCTTNSDCVYCETVWNATPAYEDWGVRTVSGAANIIYSSTDPNDPLNGSHDPNGIYYPWFLDTGKMWYGKDHTDETIVGNPIGTGIYFVLSPNAPFIGNNDIKIAKSPYDIFENMWTNGDGATYTCYDGSISYSGHIASTGTSVVVGGETITLTPASITDPIVTISYPTINNSANKIICDANNGVFSPIDWYGYYSYCAILERIQGVSPGQPCNQSEYIGAPYETTPYYIQATQGSCCGMCYPPYSIDSSGCLTSICPPNQ